MRCPNCGADSAGPSCTACGAAMPAGGPPGALDGGRTVLSGESGATVQAADGQTIQADALRRP